MIENNSETQNCVNIEDILTALDELSKILMAKFGKKSKTEKSKQISGK